MKKTIYGLLAAIGMMFAVPAQAIDLSPSQSGCVFGEFLCSVADYSNLSDHNPSPVGSYSVTEVSQVEKTDNFDENFGRGLRGLKKAVHKARDLRKNGYKDVRLSKNRKGFRVTGTKTELVDVATTRRVRGDGPNNDSSGGTAGNSNGMRGNDIDSGNWN